MLVKVNADATNTKGILTLLEEMGYSLPCNCNGRHHCSGQQYPFDCSMIPKAPIGVSLPLSQENIFGLSLENMTKEPGTGNTLLIDLGTTTIAMALIDRHSGALRQTAVFSNPQIKFGTDVISRIYSAIQGNKEQLQQDLLMSIQEKARLLFRRNGQDLSDATHCFIAGNTTMIHLLMGYDCTPLSRSPFKIRMSSPEPFFYNNCQVQIFPWISAFIGGDITAGLYGCRMLSTNKSCLLIDLGTNGEMVLCHHGKIYAAATAAGPAFEGNGLSCGCPSIPGAICHVRFKRLRPSLTTIDNKLPIGICGTGAISLTAELLRHGYMEPDGILTEKFPKDGILLGRQANGTVLRFTADDLRHVQLSIAAIAAGIDTLTHAAAVKPDELQQLYLAGGFGFSLDLHDCKTLNMLPALDENSVHFPGNTCLGGIYQYAIHSTSPLEIPDVELIDLAQNSYFKEHFISHMKYLPYTET